MSNPTTASAFQQAIHHAYAQTDGSYKWPNSREGDMLREAKKEVDQLGDALRCALSTMSIAAGILEKDGDESGVAANLRGEIALGKAALGIDEEAERAIDAALADELRRRMANVTVEAHIAALRGFPDAGRQG